MVDDLVLGIDGGGSKTLAVLVDRAGRVRQLAQAGGTNPLDNPAWRTELSAVLGPLANAPGIVAAVAALPGYGEVEAVSLEQSGAVAGALGTRPQSILNDVDAAHIGAFGGQSGILILSGTGSMAWARDDAGRSHRVGGWGDAIGDEGSAHWIGLRILGVVSQSLDGRAPATGLVDALFAHLGLDTATPSDSLQGWVSGLAHPRSAIAALAPLAMRLAEAGDAAAMSIIDGAAEELGRHVTAIARHVRQGAPWSYAGGAFRSPLLLAAVTRSIGHPPVAPRLSPIGGALLAAAKLADWPISSSWIDALAASLQGAPVGHTALELTTT